jgi:small neutral amino acid transporter SnatA (MarC family)
MISAELPLITTTFAAALVVVDPIEAVSLFLAAIGIQFVISGIRNLFPPLVK